jgi:hypothetical protein
LSDEEARIRIGKADGTEMNAISWVVGHIAQHWLSIASVATGERRAGGLRPSAEGLRPFSSGPNADPTPPPLADTIALLSAAAESLEWIGNADAEHLSSKPGSNPEAESLGTTVMRAALHTWYHLGEIAAVRQMMGHTEVPFVGRMAGKLEWGRAPEGGETP